jgi:Holliday junction resolvase RusA-like endonuclease
LKAQRPGRVEGAVEVSIALGRPDNRKRDLDNAGKAVMDLLVAHQVIEDDSQVMRISSGWDLTVPPGRAMIIVKSAMAAETIAS